MSDEIRCPYCGGNGKVNVMSGVTLDVCTSPPINWHQIISPMQPCHSFTLETGKLDCDEPTIVEAKHVDPHGS